MPICTGCKKQFPNRVLIDGKHKILTSRRFCLECSPFMTREGWKKSEAEKNKLKHTTTSVCKFCNREYVYNKNKGHTRERCNSCAVNLRRFDRKNRAIEYKGGKCVLCGFNKYKAALTFHHLDPTKKEFGISGSHAHSWDKIQAELDKCILLCHNCHAAFHSGELDKTQIMGLSSIS